MDQTRPHKRSQDIRASVYDEDTKNVLKFTRCPDVPLKSFVRFDICDKIHTYCHAHSCHEICAHSRGTQNNDGESIHEE